MARCYKTLICIRSINAYYHSPLGNVKNCLELELTFDGEVLDGKMILPIVGQALVERAVLLGCDILGIASPEKMDLRTTAERRFRPELMGVCQRRIAGFVEGIRTVRGGFANEDPI